MFIIVFNMYVIGFIKKGLTKPANLAALFDKQAGKCEACLLVFFAVSISF